MRWILLQNSKIPIGNSFRVRIEGLIVCPKTIRRFMHLEFLQILFICFFEKKIQLPGLRIAFNLIVPLPPILFIQPVAQLSELGLGQGRNCLFYFLNCGHNRKCEEFSFGFNFFAERPR